MVRCEVGTLRECLLEVRSLESLDGYVIATSMVDLAETLVEAMNKSALVDRIAVDKLVAHMPVVSNSA